jgi:NTE family protein
MDATARRLDVGAGPITVPDLSEPLTSPELSGSIRCPNEMVPPRTPMTDSKHHPPLEPLRAFRGAHRGVGPGDLGIVMGGGGARAAYQVGLLRCLARRFPELNVPYITGVSAGAINAAHLAAHHGTFLQAVDELTHLWGDLRIEDVFRVGSWSMAKNAVSWGVQLVSGGTGRTDYVRGFVDTQPLREYLSEVMHAVDGELTGIQYNLDRGSLKAIAIATSSYTTGESVAWVQGKDIQEWERPYRRARLRTITIEHVMASCALPLFFPAVQLEGGWYGDGGIRLTEPLSPVIHLGARRVIAVSTRTEAASRVQSSGISYDYPPPAQIVGVLMNSVFLDLLDADAARVQRINQLLESLPQELHGGLRGVRLLTLRPSVDLGELAYLHEPDLPRAFRFMTRGLGTRATDSPDFLSLILFDPDYIRTLIEIGEQDAEARAEEIEDFIFGRSQANEEVASV